MANKKQCIMFPVTQLQLPVIQLQPPDGWYHTLDRSPTHTTSGERVLATGSEGRCRRNCWGLRSVHLFDAVTSVSRTATRSVPVHSRSLLNELVQSSCRERYAGASGGRRWPNRVWWRSAMGICYDEREVHQSCWLLNASCWYAVVLVPPDALCLTCLIITLRLCSIMSKITNEITTESRIWKLTDKTPWRHFRLTKNLYYIWNGAW